MSISIETLVLAKNFAKSYTDAAIAAFPRGMAYRGAVDYYDDLPTNATNGDVYTVKYAGSSGDTPLGAEYGWGTYEGTDQWIDLGPDLSNYQPLLVSGTNIKTLNNQSLLGSGNIDTKELFYCTYGTTTFAQVTQALSDGKLPICLYNDNRYYIYCSSTSTVHRFSSAQSDYIRYVTINDSNVWATSAYNLELATNKVTSISSSSTDTQYPSAKCVYDYAQPTLVSGTNIKTINSNSILGSGDMIIATNQEFPSSWPVSSSTTTKAFCDVVNADSTAVEGMSYLGEV